MGSLGRSDGGPSPGGVAPRPCLAHRGPTRCAGARPSPSHHPAAEYVEHHGQRQELRRGRDVGDIGHPQPVRGLGFEATLDQAQRRAGLGVSTRGTQPLATTHCGQAGFAHPPSHPLGTLAGVPEAASRMNPRRPVRPTAALVNRLDTRPERLVRCLARRALTLTLHAIPARGDSEYTGHRGYRTFGLIRSHEPVDLPGTVSRANQAFVGRRFTGPFACPPDLLPRYLVLQADADSLGAADAAPRVALRLDHPVAERLCGRFELPSRLLRAPSGSNPARPSGAGAPAHTAVSTSAWWIPPPSTGQATAKSDRLQYRGLRTGGHRGQRAASR